MEHRAEGSAQERENEKNGIDEIDGIDVLDEIDGIDETDEMDEIDQTDDIDEIDGIDETDEIDDIDQIDQIDETDGIDQIDEIDETDEIDEKTREGEGWSYPSKRTTSRPLSLLVQPSGGWTYRKERSEGEQITSGARTVKELFSNVFRSPTR